MAKRTKKTSSKKRFEIRRASKPSLRSLSLLIAVLLICVGMAAGGYGAITTWFAQRHIHGPALVSNIPPHSSSPLIYGTPTHISIPDVSIDLDVIPGYYHPADNSWTLTDTSAQWGAMTAQANNKGGDTYIYAHALMNLFGRLPNIKPGQEAIVTTDNGHVFTYKFVSSKETVPTDTSLFTYKGKPILVLQTCSGLWYQYRQLFMFDLEKVS